MILKKELEEFVYKRSDGSVMVRRLIEQLFKEKQYSQVVDVAEKLVKANKLNYFKDIFTLIDTFKSFHIQVDCVDTDATSLNVFYTL
jgi:hypothetical protein